MAHEIEEYREDHERWIVAMRRRLEALADDAMVEMVNLAHGAVSEAVRYQANKDLLDRAGVKAAPQVQRVDVDVAVHDAELRRVEAETEALLARLDRNVKALPGPEHDLTALIILEGDDEDLVPGDVVEGAIEATSHEVNA